MREITQIHFTCSRRELANGENLYAHGAILPMIVNVRESRELVLEPEFIISSDNTTELEDSTMGDQALSTDG